MAIVISLVQYIKWHIYYAIEILIILGMGYLEWDRREHSFFCSNYMHANIYVPQWN